MGEATFVKVRLPIPFQKTFTVLSHIYLKINNNS